MSRKLSLTAVAVCLVLVLGACETDPATDVTHNAATLNAKGRCYTGLSGWSRYQLRNVTTGGTFAGVGDRYTYNCGGDTGVVQFEPKRIGGLTPGHLYQFRLRTELDNGQKFWTDSVGTQGGTNYDSFRARTDSQQSVVCAQSPGAVGCEGTIVEEGGSDGADSTECLDPNTTVCSSGPQKYCKGRDGNPLTNSYVYKDQFITSRRADTNHDWCWNPNTNRIIDRHSIKDAWMTGWGEKLLWYVKEKGVDGGKWSYSSCTPDMSSCLYRFQVRYACCVPITIFPIVTNTVCLATRICAYRCGENGAPHSRAIIRGECPT